jgi:SAM-dependent methyltransferase
VTALDADAEAVRGAAAWVDAMLAEDKETAEAGGQGHAVVGDGLALPFPDGCFDKVIAAEVLEHVPDDSSVLAELARVLRPGGVIAVTVPRWYPEGVNWALSTEYHNVPGGHVRIYRRQQLRDRLRGAGLGPYREHHAHALHSPYWWLRCALGTSSERNRVVQAYHRLLVWDITAKNPLTRWPEAVLNPVLGKSLVVYARKL